MAEETLPQAPRVRVRLRPPAPTRAGAVGRSAQDPQVAWALIAPCLFYLFVECSRPMAWVPPLAAVRLGLIAAVWGFVAVARRKDIAIPAGVKIMAAFAAMMAVEVPFATNNYWALMTFLDFITLVGGYVLPLSVLPRSIADIRVILTGYTFCHVPTAIYALMHEGRGAGGWLGDENDLALAMNVSAGIGITLLLSLTHRPAVRAMLLASTALQVAATVASKSRGGFVGLAALFLFLIGFSPKRGRVLGVAVACGVGMALLAPPEFWKEVASIRHATNEHDTGSQRLEYWAMGWRMFLDHPILGVGSSNFGIAADAYEDKLNAEMTGHYMWGRVAHSLYFTLIPEHGLVGISIFATLIVWWLRCHGRLLRLSRAAPAGSVGAWVGPLSMAIAAGCVTFLLTGTFVSVLYYPPFWVLLGILGSLDRIVTGSTSRATAEGVGTPA